VAKHGKSGGVFPACHVNSYTTRHSLSVNQVFGPSRTSQSLLHSHPYGNSSTRRAAREKITNVFSPCPNSTLYKECVAPVLYNFFNQLYYHRRCTRQNRRHTVLSPELDNQLQPQVHYVTISMVLTEGHSYNLPLLPFSFLNLGLHTD